MGKKNSVSILITFSYIVLFSLVFLGVSRLIYGFFELFKNFNFKILFLMILNLIYFFNYFKATDHLLAILKSTSITPFIYDNVKRFKSMGYYLLINTLFELFMSVNMKNFKLIGTGDGSLGPIFIICFISSLMCFILSEIFNSAIKIKKDNDFTI